jgi:D-3-phosphoglycerate dehydrogenase
MEVYGYDPYLSVNAAWRLSTEVKHADKVETIYEKSDYITIHVPAMDSTRGMINADAIAQMKDGVKFINFARDVLVNDDDMAAALESGKVSCYVVDFPNAKNVKMKNVIAIPHLGASTEEAEDNCAIMVADQMTDYIKNGNIRNSVNYPNCDMGPATAPRRIVLLHKNVPNMLGRITALLGDAGVNIARLANEPKGEQAYTMIDTDSEIPDSVIDALKATDAIHRVRIIHKDED